MSDFYNKENYFDYMRVKDISLITMSLTLFFVKKGDDNLWVMKRKLQVFI